METLYKKEREDINLPNWVSIRDLIMYASPCLNRQLLH
jgi:hypothetical protein